LLEYLVGERNFAENTRRSYRDTLALLIPFIATATTTTVDRLRISDLAADGVRQFLTRWLVASHDKNAVISAVPIVAGCFLL
jgi:site-specific recombinase XerD